MQGPRLLITMSYEDVHKTYLALPARPLSKKASHSISLRETTAACSSPEQQPFLEQMGGEGPMLGHPAVHSFPP